MRGRVWTQGVWLSQEVGAFVVKEVDNIVTNLLERRLCIINDNGNDVILSRQMGEVETEVDDIISYFYRTYRGEGANKLATRIERWWNNTKYVSWVCLNICREMKTILAKSPFSPIKHLFHRWCHIRYVALVIFVKYPQRKDGNWNSMQDAPISYLTMLHIEIVCKMRQFRNRGSHLVCS